MWVLREMIDGLGHGRLQLPNAAPGCTASAITGRSSIKILGSFSGPSRVLGGSRGPGVDSLAVLYCRTVPGDYTMNTLPCAVQGHRFNVSKV